MRLDPTPFFSVTPYCDESVGGYMLRISEVNLGWSAQHLLQAVFGSKSRFTFEKAGALADFCRSDPASVCELSGYWRLRDGIDESMIGEWWIPRRPHVVRSCSALCPVCLDETPYSKAIWDVALVSCCPCHRTMLVDRCPQCGLLVSIRRNKVCQCRCGHDYRSIKPVLVSCDAVEIARDIQNDIWRNAGSDLLSEIDVVNKISAQTNLLSTLQYFWFFGATFPTLVAGIPTRGQSTMSKIRAISVCDEAVKIMRDWPGSFFYRLDRLHRTRSRRDAEMVDRVLRAVWAQIVALTSRGDVIDMRGAFVAYVRSYVAKKARNNSLKICLNQKELPFG